MQQNGIEVQCLEIDEDVSQLKAVKMQNFELQKKNDELIFELTHQKSRKNEGEIEILELQRNQN